MSSETRATHPAAAAHTRRGRRRRPERPPARTRTRVALGAAVTVVGVVVAAWASGAVGAIGDTGESTPGGSESTTCPDGRRTLTVAAAPELAPVLEAATGPGGLLGPDAECVDVQVSPAAPAEVAMSLRGAGARGPVPPDVWVPDSSIWLQDLPVGEHVTTAVSPVVFAVSEAVAGRLGWPAATPDVVAGLTSSAPPRLAIPETDRSAAARAGLLAVQQVVAAQPDGQQRLADLFRGAELSLPDDAASQLGSVEGPGSLAVPTSEQAVWAHTGREGSSSVVASYPAGAGSLDYPLVVLARGDAAKADAELVRQAVTEDAWVELVQTAGFRAPDGSASDVLGDHPGIDATAGTGATPPDPQLVSEAVRTFTVITSGTRLLAVVDVSGSMAASVPEVPGRTRMDLAIGAAGNGLGLYPDDAEVGLWVFSTNLNGATDHLELVPVGPLGLREDGSRGRERLSQALAGVTYVPTGDTGLYDTALAAVRTVREGWDPDSVNSVVLMTDGRNDDENSLSLEQLLAALQAEGTDRPVPVIGIGFGPESDVEALREISRVTGGTTYEVRDVRRIHEVLADALASRPCRPNC